MPQYIAGAVRGTNATIRYGAGFSVVKTNQFGSYRISIPPTAGGRLLVPVVTPGTSNVTFRVSSYVMNPDGSHTIDIECRDVHGALFDSDFTFVAIAAS